MQYTIPVVLHVHHRCIIEAESLTDAVDHIVKNGISQYIDRIFTSDDIIEGNEQIDFDGLEIYNQNIKDTELIEIEQTLIKERLKY
jgi:hypothetical protein